MGQDTLHELIAAASEGIRQAWKDGQVKYPDNPWQQKSTAEHLNHAKNHLVEFGFLYGDKSENHLSHALFRIAAAFWRTEHGLDK
mgnify:CR=1 FL=1